MKRFLLLFLLLLAREGFSQVPDKALKGYVVNLSHDTIKGYIIKRGELGSQKKVTFYNQEGQEFIFKSDSLKAYSYFTYDDGNEEECAYEQIIMRNKRNIFLYRETDGEARIYEYYYLHLHVLVAPIPIIIPTKEKSTIIKKGDGPYVSIRKGKFRKWCSEYFNDYPELARKIEAKQYKRSDINIIVEEYNSWYKSK